MVVGDCGWFFGWLWVVAYFSITHRVNSLLKSSDFLCQSWIKIELIKIKASRKLVITAQYVFYYVSLKYYRASIYLFKVNNRSNRKTKKYETCPNDVLVFLLLTLNIFHTFHVVSVIDFEQANVSWLQSILYNHFNNYIVDKRVPCRKKFEENYKLHLVGVPLWVLQLFQLKLVSTLKKPISSFMKYLWKQTSRKRAIPIFVQPQDTGPSLSYIFLNNSKTTKRLFISPITQEILAADTFYWLELITVS